ncbi:unnamed protein product, partial [Allacma fusca]
STSFTESFLLDKIIVRVVVL